MCEKPGACRPATAERSGPPLAGAAQYFQFGAAQQHSAARGPRRCEIGERVASVLQIILADLFLGHLDLFDDMIDNLVLEDRGAQLLLHARVFLHEFKELPFLPGILTGLLHDRLGHFRIAHLDVGLAAKLGQQQPEAHAALGQ